MYVLLFFFGGGGWEGGVDKLYMLQGINSEITTRFITLKVWNPSEIFKTNLLVWRQEAVERFVTVR